MKTLLSCAMLASLACLASAQPGSRPGGRGEKKGMDPAIREMMQAERQAVKPLERDLRDAALKLKDLIEDESSDKDLQAGMDRVEKARKALEARREKFAKELEAKISVRERAAMMVLSVLETSGLGRGRMMMRREGMRVERRGRPGGGGWGGGEEGEGWSPQGHGDREPMPEGPGREGGEDSEE
jgi:hypothetical protein